MLQKNKAELLVKAFAKVHSSDNLSREEARYREQTIIRNRQALEGEEEMKSYFDITGRFSIFELNRALSKTKELTPGKDQITYSMIRNLTDISKEVLLKLYYKVWEEGDIPLEWKEAIIVPICKPGKDPSQANSYRPIALTSNVGKVMEKTINERMIYYIESRQKFKSYQSGFRKGRITIDPAIRLEDERRKAKANKESL